MSKPNLKSLAALLISMTKRSLIDWKATVDKYRFIFAEDEATVELYAYYDDDGGKHCVAISLRNAQGDIIDRFVVTSSDNEYPDYEELFNGARRKANNADELIEKFINKLSNPQPSKPEEDLPF